MNNKIIMGAILASIVIGISIGIIGTAEASTNETVSTTAQPQQNTSPVSGSISIDGSSTVYPITEVIAEEFSIEQPDTQTTVSVSGTGGGFNRFAVGETDINDSSRPMAETEKATAAENSVNWVEIPIALEGVTIVVSPDNNLIANDCISIEQLKEMWQPERTIVSWNDLNASNPDQQIRLYGPGPDSGTFDFFTEEVVGEARSSTTDYIPSEDDNILVQGVQNDNLALGYIPLSYAEAAGDRLKIIGVSDADGQCVHPSTEAVTTGEYPLSRPLFIHVNYDELQDRPELQAFVEFYLNNAGNAAETVQVVALPDAYYTEAISTLQEGEYTTNDNSTFNDLYLSLS